MPIDPSIALQFQGTKLIDPMTMYNSVQEQRFNALRGQALQQDMARNALAMQYTQEDRARAEEARRQAAAQAAQDKLVWETSLKFGDRAKQKSYLEGLGRYDMAGRVNAYEEGSAKASSALSDADKKKIEVVDTQLKQFNAGLERAASIPEVHALIDGSADAIRATGKTPEMSKQSFNDLVAKVGFQQAVMQVSQGVMATQKHVNDILTAQKPELKQDAQGNWVAINPYTGEAVPAATAQGEPVAGASTETQIKQQAKETGKQAVDVSLDRLSEEYAALDKMGAAPSEKKSWFENAYAKLITSSLGKFANIEPKAQTRIQNITGLRRDLVQMIKMSTGMSAQEMNSNVELQGLLDAATDPNQNIESVVQRLADISVRYGSGKLKTDKAAVAQPAKTAPSTTNSKGWTLHTDANGNRAYVSPDGKQFEEVK